jgi:hypothetical protein
MLIKATEEFKFFVLNIFSESFPKFKRGQFLEDLCDWMQGNDWFMRISARDHFKSTSLYADFMWRLLKHAYENKEYHYFSYQDTMAGYHISKIKRLIYNNPFYKDCTDMKTMAESVMKYSWDSKYKGDKAHIITMESHGLMSFKRGIHCDGVYVDDPFQDPDNKLLLTKVYKINDIIKTQILDMPKEFCKIVGTPQTTDDFFFDRNLRDKFSVMIQSAEKDHKNQVALWPEHMSWNELQSRKIIRGKKIYSQEYLCTPAYSENSWFTEAEIMKVINPDLRNMSIFDIIKSPEKIDTIGGWDLGKKRHPSHLSVFQIRIKDGKRTAVQIHEVFFDQWDYAGNDDGQFDPDHPTQISYIKQAIRNFKIDKLFADGTRGELTTIQERGELPPEIELVTFTIKEKYSMATEFEKGVNEKYIELQNDPRMIRQILAVTNDLQAVETHEGHGDAFWSTALCFKGIKILLADIGEFTPHEDDESSQSDIYNKSF